MIDESMKIALGIVMFMIFGLSALSFYYSVKELAKTFIKAFKDGEL